MTHHLHHTLKSFQAAARQGQFYSLPELAKTYPNVNRLPVSICIVLEIVSLGARRGQRWSCLIGQLGGVS